MYKLKDFYFNSTFSPSIFMLLISLFTIRIWAIVNIYLIYIYSIGLYSLEALYLWNMLILLIIIAYSILYISFFIIKNRKNQINYKYLCILFIISIFLALGINVICYALSGILASEDIIYIKAFLMFIKGVNMSAFAIYLIHRGNINVKQIIYMFILLIFSISIYLTLPPYLTDWLASFFDLPIIISLSMFPKLRILLMDHILSTPRGGHNNTILKSELETELEKGIPGMWHSPLDDKDSVMGNKTVETTDPSRYKITHPRPATVPGPTLAPLDTNKVLEASKKSFRENCTNEGLPTPRTPSPDTGSVTDTAPFSCTAPAIVTGPTTCPPQTSRTIFSHIKSVVDKFNYAAEEWKINKNKSPEEAGRAWRNAHNASKSLTMSRLKNKHWSLCFRPDQIEHQKNIRSGFDTAYYKYRNHQPVNERGLNDIEQWIKRANEQRRKSMIDEIDSILKPKK